MWFFTDEHGDWWADKPAGAVLVTLSLQISLSARYPNAAPWRRYAER